MGDCGGALVAPDIVLFAAHCQSFKDKQISIGAYKTQSLAEGAQDRFCDKWVADPNYDGATTNSDFALCKLNEPIKIDETKVKLEINDDDSFPETGSDLQVMGLGALSEGGSSPEFLHDVTVPVVSNKACNKPNAYNGQITDLMMCAGFLKTGGKDSCQGDSGGPIVQRKKNSDGTFTDYHVGVVSWGIGCAQKNKPGVYARTSKRASWIKDVSCGKLKSVASFCNPLNDPPSPPDNCGGDLTVKVTTDKYAFETSWTLKDSDDKAVQTRQYLISKHDNEHKLCLKADECYEWRILDEYGDGMCAEGCGSYSLTLDGKEIVSGTGKFKKSKKHKFCTGGDTNPVSTPTEAPALSPTAAPAKETDAPTNEATFEQSFEQSQEDSFEQSQGDSFEFSQGDSFEFSQGDSFEFSQGDSFEFSQGDSFEFSTGDSFEWSQGDSFEFSTGDSFEFSQFSYDDEFFDDGFDTDEPSTETPTIPPTSAPTSPPTSAPTKAPTAAPTNAPTTAPTAAPTNVPTLSPTTSPTASPTGSCEDSEEFFYKEKENKTCEWVGKGKRKAVRKKCKKKWDTMKVFEWCPETCAEVGMGPCA
jgi:hypothetical protein